VVPSSGRSGYSDCDSRLFLRTCLTIIPRPHVKEGHTAWAPTPQNLTHRAPPECSGPVIACAVLHIIQQQHPWGWVRWCVHWHSSAAGSAIPGNDKDALEDPGGHPRPRRPRLVCGVGHQEPRGAGNGPKRDDVRQKQPRARSAQTGPRQGPQRRKGVFIHTPLQGGAQPHSCSWDGVSLTLLCHSHSFTCGLSRARPASRSREEAQHTTGVVSL